MADPPVVAPGDDLASKAPRRRKLRAPHRGQPRPLRQISRGLRVLGPGLITGAADDDPSGIGAYSQAGAAYGFGLLWLAPFILPLAIAVQEMCGRIGLVTGKGIVGVARNHYSRWVLLGAVVLLFIANTINVGADLGAMAASVQLLTPVPFIPTLVFLAFAILLIEIFVPYKYYAHVLKILTLSLLSYILTGLIVGADWGELARATFVPTIIWRPDFFALVVAVIGTTISPYLFFWQASEEVEEAETRHREARGHDDARQRKALLLQLRGLRVDTALGMFAATIGFYFIVMTTSATLHANGITSIASAAQAAAALEPLVKSFPGAGYWAKVIFSVGVIGTGLLAIPVLAGASAYGISEAFGWREGLAKPLFQARGFYAVIAASTLAGLLLNLLGINPIQALVYAAVINGVVAAPLLVLILLIANNRSIMGTYTNRILSNTLGIFTALVMAVAAVATIVTSLPH